MSSSRRTGAARGRAARRIAEKFTHRAGLMLIGSEEAEIYERDLRDDLVTGVKPKSLYWEGHLDAVRDMQYAEVEIVAAAVEEYMEDAIKEVGAMAEEKTRIATAKLTIAHAEIENLSQALADCQGTGPKPQLEQGDEADALGGVQADQGQVDP